MQVEERNITKEAKTLKDYIPLVITFFAGLIVLSIYQNTILYYKGVLDSVLNISLFIHVLHHLGFASVCAVILAFLFNLLENKKPSLGFTLVRGILAFVLVLEGVLITYFVGNYEPFGLHADFVNEAYVKFPAVQGLVAITVTLVFCHFLYRYMAPFYKVISRMYPFTIILFSLFLSTLYSDRKPINENKTQYLLESLYTRISETDTYEGNEEYPLARVYVKDTALASLFALKSEKPHIKILIVEGLGSTFTDTETGYAGIMPKLNELKSASLYWPNYLSNTGESQAALPHIIGSLPFGEIGFTQLESFTHRNTLYGILKKNGYRTSFNFGGNSALHGYDKFLVQEGVDRILDKAVFGKEYTVQEADAAGITLGYPDKDLFKRYGEEQGIGSAAPQLDVLYTLSSKNPFAIPQQEQYINKVERYLARSTISAKSKRLISHHLELFASYSYVDDALHLFFEAEKKTRAYHNTIYLITGSNLNRNLPAENALERYRVPLIVYGPLVKQPKIMETVASHADLAPSLVSLLDAAYTLDVPKEIAWLGDNALVAATGKQNREIPLYRGAHTIHDYIYGHFFLSDGNATRMNTDFSFNDSEVPEDTLSLIREKFQYSRAVNKYVTQQDKLVPSAVSLATNHQKEFSKTDMIWLQSVFNGKDFDKAYGTARKLAFDKDWDKALLLCDYILWQIPRHADTEILKGRVYSWQGDYLSSIKVLREVIRKYPEYADGYCALLDTYYWSDPNKDISALVYQIKSQKIDDALVIEKIARANAYQSDAGNTVVKLDRE